MFAFEVLTSRGKCPAKFSAIFLFENMYLAQILDKQIVFLLVQVADPELSGINFQRKFSRSFRFNLTV